MLRAICYIGRMYGERDKFILRGTSRLKNQYIYNLTDSREMVNMVNFPRSEMCLEKLDRLLYGRVYIPIEINKCSPIGAWKCNFSPFMEIITAQ